MDTKEKEFYNAVILSTVIIGIILAYFIFSIIKQQLRNQQLSRNKVIAEIRALENERQRISSDLHDELGPILSTIKIQLSLLEIKMGADKILIEQSCIQIDTIIRMMREISNNMSPGLLKRKGIAVATENYISKVNFLGDLNILFKHDTNNRYHEDIEINSYRIIQEVVHNTIKHAKASVLMVKLEEDGKILRISTVDNGIGFSFTESMGEVTGLGLLNLQSRTEIMKGEFHVKSSKKNGTRYIFEIPIHT